MSCIRVTRPRPLRSDSWKTTECGSIAWPNRLRRTLQVRYLFVTILSFCQPADPLTLYETNEANLMRDFVERFRDADRARAACLDAIVDLLQDRGKTLTDFGLPLPDATLLESEPDHGVFDDVDAAVR